MAYSTPTMPRTHRSKSPADQHIVVDVLESSFNTRLVRITNFRAVESPQLFGKYLNYIRADTNAGRWWGSFMGNITTVKLYFAAHRPGTAVCGLKGS